PGRPAVETWMQIMVVVTSRWPRSYWTVHMSSPSRTGPPFTIRANASPDRARECAGIGASALAMGTIWHARPSLEQSGRRGGHQHPTHGYQHDRPSLLQAPLRPRFEQPPRTSERTNGTRDPTITVTLDSGSHINAGSERRRADANQPSAPVP